MSGSIPAYRIRVEPSGVYFEATATDTLLASALRQGVMLPHSCGNGGCGSCKMRWVSGVLDHPDGDQLAIDAQERADGWVLACQARAASDVVLHSERVSSEPAFAVRQMPARVLSLARLASDVMQVKLQHAGEPLGFHAGQHVQLTLRDGTTRAYSLANAPVPAQGLSCELELHIRHMPHGRFSGQVFESMKIRDMLKMTGPLGDFRLNESSSKPIVLLASGTGFAPIKSMLDQVQLRGIDRPIVFYWGGRRPQDIYLRDWVEGKVRALPTLRFHPVVSDARPEDGWTGRTGLVHHAVLNDFPDLSNHEVYACGAPPMVDAARRDFSTLAKLPVGSFFADAFVPNASEATAIVA